jgi:hypothetical protein
MQTWRFYQGRTILVSTSETFFQGQRAPLGLVQILDASINLSWSTFQTVSENVPALGWVTYETVSEDTPDIPWLTYIEVSQQLVPLWNTYIKVDTNSNKRYVYQGRFFPELKDKFFQGQWFVSDFLHNTFYWYVFDIFPGITLPAFEWSVAPAVFRNITTDWLTGARFSTPMPEAKWLTGGGVSRTMRPRWLVGGNVSNSKEFRWSHFGVFDMAYGLQAYKFNRYRVPNNVNYLTCRTISILNTSGASLSAGSTMDLVIDHAAMVAAGEVDEYGDQFRLTWTPSDRAERELDVEVIHPNTSTTILRFKLQSGLAVSAMVSDYRLYYGVADTNLFEETFRDRKGTYYFWANRLSSNLNLVNGSWSNSLTGIQRADDGNTAKLGFNVPDNADVEIDFRFLDVGDNDQSRYLGLEWRGDNASSRTFRLDNDNSVSNNQIAQYFDGTSWIALATPVPDILIQEATLQILVSGSTVKLSLNGSLLDTITDATAPTGGMQIVLPAGSEVNITALRIRQAIGSYSASLEPAMQNRVQVPSSHKVLLRNGAIQAVPATVLRLKKQNDDTYVLESMQPVGVAGDVISATANQQDSLEIHLYNTNDRTLATVMELNT